MFDGYEEYIQSEDWKNKRKEVLLEKGNKCFICGSSENIHIHHTNYRTLGDEDTRFLFPLCKECHEEIHSLVEEYREPLQKQIKDLLNTEKEKIVKGLLEIYEKHFMDNRNIFDKLRKIKYKYYFFAILYMTITNTDILNLRIGCGRSIFTEVWGKLRRQGDLIKLGIRPKKEGR